MQNTLDRHIYRPADPEYVEACQTWALAADLRPAAVAFPRSRADAAVMIRLATSEGLRVAPLGTGHNAYPFGDLSDTVLVRTEHLNSYQADTAAGIARVGAGAIWGPLVDMLGEHGLAALHGSAPDAGIVGYALGGGAGWYGRAHGLAANTVTAVELITADGTFVRTDEDHDPQLFWALRGGGAGNFGLVTAIEFQLHRFRTAYAGMLVWDLREAERVLPRWADWARDAPDAVTTAYRQVQYPLVPQFPEELRGRNLVIVDGAVLGNDADAERVLAPLRALRPRLDTFRRMPARALSRLHLDPEGPSAGGVRTTLLGELPPPAVDRLLEASSGSSLVVTAELRQLGGALGRPAPGGGVLNRLDGQFLLLAGGVKVGPYAERTIFDYDRTIDAMEPWTNGRNYLNFTQQPVDPSTGFDPGAWQSLLQIRRRVDPSGVFRSNHQIPLI
ncbi:FAD-binding oxidoreductase [Cryptosporangium phraense]|uniref:FAD-binding oxidoreductase n=1 Tax=Cryptosporangium phraense TaxID=2593070 RepID=A0A545AFL6_9ACTN|nr:FAD-binding oxidoreductase [Cryptosporangium phraense]TQS40124.1 FAD-binding oxidoreductase [Cryptosporangium phraense]